jgi:chromosome segregation ATPase
MVKKLIPALAIFILVSGAYDIEAQKLYTWTDAQGVIHITQDPPPQNARQESVTVYPAKSLQEMDAIERKKQEIRKNYRQFEKREAVRQAEINAREAQQQAQEAIQKVQQETEENQEYVRRLSSTQQKRRQFRKKIERIENETEAAQTEAEKAQREADAAVKKAQQAASGENISQ